jgi:hypothetical protein
VLVLVIQWPKWKKTSILVIVSIYSFLGNCSLVGPSVYIDIYSEEFGIPHAEASGLISYPNLAFGFGAPLPRLPVPAMSNSRSFQGV